MHFDVHSTLVYMAIQWKTFRWSHVNQNPDRISFSASFNVLIAVEKRILLQSTLYVHVILHTLMYACVVILISCPRVAYRRKRASSSHQLGIIRDLILGNITLAE